VSVVLGVIIATTFNSPQDAGMSLVLILAGVPVYWGWKAWSRRGA
jgi:APA family basic amino acid/polyamine antiporter